MVGERVRLDQELVAQGLVASRARAQAMLRAGLVLLNGEAADRPDRLVDRGVRLELRGSAPYVSRGGEKLSRALDVFGLTVRGRACLDVGASTGGFTDVLLQRGAASVIALDVGYGQLAWSIRQDKRVTVLERVNVRYLERLPSPANLAVIDVSFISLRLVLPAVRQLLSNPFDVVALVKPQFEVGRGAVGKGGIVHDVEQHRSVLSGLTEFAGKSGFEVAGETSSPILGAKGNREFFLYVRSHD
jgi:23S rRNA (cytidine1920-2'-O)/16S rRNA (cytidine1409-2'-O)-methyltransferase